MIDLTRVNVVPVLAEIIGNGNVVVFKNEDGKWYLRDSTGAETELAQAGGDGSNGWSPELSVETDSARRVLKLVDWIGGSGTEPDADKYIGATGFVDLVGDAIDIRGPQGAAGADGSNGINGTDGNAAWNPLFVIESDSARRVLKVDDWAGGGGIKPDAGYITAAGALDPDIADGVDIRGPAGADGTDGTDGDKGWAPVFALVNDSARRVLQLVDYVGGTGTEPTDNLNEYVGPTGYTATIGSAVDLRGPAGAGSGDVAGPGVAVTGGKLVVWQGTTGTDIREIAGGDAAAARSDLDVYSIGDADAAFQPIHALLTAIAGLTSAADKGVRLQAGNTAETFDLSDFALTFLDDADASTVRATLGLAIGSNVQAFDADLSGLAALTWGANGYVYTDGSSVKTIGTLSSFARTILDDADATTVRSTIGAAATAHTHAQSDITNLATSLAAKGNLAGGNTWTGNQIIPNQTAGDNSTKAANTGYVDSAISGLSTVYQPLDDTLSGLSTVVTAADNLIYATGVDTFAASGLSAFGRSLIDDAAAVNARTTLELVLADVTAIRANTADRVPYFDDMVSAAAFVALTDAGATITWDMSTVWPNGSITLNGNDQFSNPTNVKVGTSGILQITQDATGSRVPTWAANFKNTSSVTLSTAANAVDLVGWFARTATSIIIFPIAYNVG